MLSSVRHDCCATTFTADSVDTAEDMHDRHHAAMAERRARFHTFGSTR